jgi:hypothetical protein
MRMTRVLLATLVVLLALSTTINAAKLNANLSRRAAADAAAEAEFFDKIKSAWNSATKTVSRHYNSIKQKAKDMGTLVHCKLTCDSPKECVENVRCAHKVDGVCPKYVCKEQDFGQKMLDKAYQGLDTLDEKLSEGSKSLGEGLESARETLDKTLVRYGRVSGKFNSMELCVSECSGICRKHREKEYYVCIKKRVAQGAEIAEKAIDVVDEAAVEGAEELRDLATKAEREAQRVAKHFSAFEACQRECSKDFSKRHLIREGLDNKICARDRTTKKWSCVSKEEALKRGMEGLEKHGKKIAKDVENYARDKVDKVSKWAKELW